MTIWRSTKCGIAARPPGRPGDPGVSENQSAQPSCNSCGDALDAVVVDLGQSPLANSYLKEEQLSEPEPFYPLCTYRCVRCALVQVPEVQASAAIFSDYAYFSSVSSSWVDHARRYVGAMVDRFELGPDSLVVEVASNDGYLLQHVVERGIPALGVEPASNIAREAQEKHGVSTLNCFLGRETGQAIAGGTVAPGELLQPDLLGRQADLVVANNVFAHVPDLNDFTAGLRALLSPSGVLTIEVQHLLQLLQEVQFDTIYHEHFSYYSLAAAKFQFERHGLELFDVEELPTHGGSLRMFVQHRGGPHKVADPVPRMLAREKAAGLGEDEVYERFRQRVESVRDGLRQFLKQCREQGKVVVGYGAPAKGNTLLNYCGLGPEDLAYTADLSPHKQGLLLPGTRIPIRSPEYISETRPDFILLLPWNLREEISRQMRHVSEWGCRFVVALPELHVFDPNANEATS